ncbi:GAF and ANTAR domain-containing protein [Streptomyces sp. YIM 130001]|uniref:GAF and ANTAR domain-containing protein n=1 Tax=Streptomyces sp. YIM 130001 TaxID=2259644 RepID=UPI000E65424F|nr:GAF and ANTAR domain-containing protein [Streptomyces sp. YIM 130001]
MDWEGFATQMGTMSRDLLAQDSVDATLERITESAVEIVVGCDAAGILVVQGNRVQSLAPTDALVVRSDELQGRRGEGPNFDAARHRGEERVFRIEDLTAYQDRWPLYVDAAREFGIGSMMGFLLYTDDQELGALNLYARGPSAFTRDSETAGLLLASHAAVALSSARNADQLHQALTSRHAIGEAMGIIRERYKLPPDEAFRVMRRLSQERNIKLRDIAQQICETGTAII